MQNEFVVSVDLRDSQQDDLEGIDSQIRQIFTHLEALPQDQQLVFCSRLLYAIAEKMTPASASRAITDAREMIANAQLTDPPKSKRKQNSREKRNPQPMLESRLLELDDPHNPFEAWEHFGGAENLLEILCAEPVGSLELMLNHPLMPTGKAPRGKTNKALAKAIVERLSANLPEGSLMR